ncbi:MAG: hypothetical protein M0C28_36590 [Candidatus Moduliflexus flocculans]|nr:hypothetical protein [Candidatus Moduliflexus flocculans]
MNDRSPNFPKSSTSTRRTSSTAFKETQTLPSAATPLQEMMIKLSCKSVSEKMKGFSRKETIDYYKTIMEQAWQQVEAADTPEVKSQKYRQKLSNGPCSTRTTTTAHAAPSAVPIFVPMWWGRYDPAYRPAARQLRRPRACPDVCAAPVAAPARRGLRRIGRRRACRPSRKRSSATSATFTEHVTGVTNPPPKPSSDQRSQRRLAAAAPVRCVRCACACACAELRLCLCRWMRTRSIFAISSTHTRLRAP